MERRETKRGAASQNTARRKQKRTGAYTYYLQDHPVLVPTITLLLGGTCLYVTIFSNLLRDALLGANPDPLVRGNFNQSMGWAIAFVIGIMFLSFVFLLVNATDAIIHKVRRRPAACPRCGLAEVKGYLRFAREPVEHTEWENITCPRCDNKWYGKR
jgi:hypothetical protein